MFPDGLLGSASTCSAGSVSLSMALYDRPDLVVIYCSGGFAVRLSTMIPPLPPNVRDRGAKELRGSLTEGLVD